MFGFSRRRMKLGRLKVQLSDPAQGTKSPIRPPKRAGNRNADDDCDHENSNSDDHNHQSSSTASNTKNCPSGSSESWMVLSITGDKPAPRFNHAAAVVGNKMLVVGGEGGDGTMDDVQVLNFDQFTWTTVSSKLYLSPSSLPLKIPASKGHCLVSWGKKALMIGGKSSDPGSEKISVWAFDTETECWSLMEAKGDIPVARSGHAVVRANTVLILFGGEDSKKRKLNDLHMFDLKSMTWLPLQYKGTGPSPRSNHVAALYDDKTLFVFGGSAKSRTLNDIYSLDFETMVWSRIKVRGFHPSPRAGCCGVLCGNKWYITGGGSRKKRHSDTLIFDVLKMEWTLACTSPPYSVTANRGFSVVLIQHKEKDFLVAFGGSKKEPSNQVEVLVLDKNEHFSSGRRPAEPSKVTGKVVTHRSSSSDLESQLYAPHPCATQNLASIIDDHRHGSSRRSLSESVITDPDPGSGSVSLRKQFKEEEDFPHKVMRCLDEESSLLHSNEQKKQLTETRSFSNSCAKVISEIVPTPVESESSRELPFSMCDHSKQPPIDEERIFGCEFDEKSAILSGGGGGLPSNIYQFYESKMSSLVRKNGILEGQLAAALAGRESVEKNLSSVLRSRQETEKKLADSVKELEMLKDKLSSLELAQEEANNLSNMVHSDNVRLEHDVAFLKAVLDDTQKELHSTRGVVANERARAFQLQVEVFHLKQRLQSLEGRAPTPRKPFQV